MANNIGTWEQNAKLIISKLDKVEAMDEKLDNIRVQLASLETKENTRAGIYGGLFGGSAGLAGGALSNVLKSMFF